VIVRGDGAVLAGQGYNANGSRVLAAAGMIWEGEANGGSRWTRQQQGTWPPMAGGINT